MLFNLLCMVNLLCMNSHLNLEIEMLEQLVNVCYAVRRNKRRPDLSGVAGAMEIRLKAELAQKQAELAQIATPELPLREKHEVAA